jgi:hypothetical protein
MAIEQNILNVLGILLASGRGEKLFSLINERARHFFPEDDIVVFNRGSRRVSASTYFPTAAHPGLAEL